MNTQRRVNLFRVDGAQTVRIPKDLEFSGDEVILREDGGRLILEPAGSASLLDLLETLEPLDTEIPAIDDPPPGPVHI